MNSATDLFTFLASRHPELEDSGFAHIANLGCLTASEPVDLGDGLFLRRATANEAETIRSLLNVVPREFPFIPRRNPYETSVREVRTGPTSVSFDIQPLAEADWRYHVMTFPGSNARTQDFVEGTVLTRWRLHIGFTVSALSWFKGCALIGGTDLARVLEEADTSDAPFFSLGTDDIADMQAVDASLLTPGEDRSVLRDAMRRFKALDFVPANSPLRFLGYVSVLESLVTHAPEPKDPYDSLTRQVRQKMLLVGRRSRLPVPYDLFPPGIGPGTIWTRLYHYRSCIAHGVAPDFSGRFQCLGNAETALEFIRRSTVALMRQVLEEPQLIADLREC